MSGKISGLVARIRAAFTPTPKAPKTADADLMASMKATRGVGGECIKGSGSRWVAEGSFKGHELKAQAQEQLECAGNSLKAVGMPTDGLPPRPPADWKTKIL